jgi:hypothetical protein
VAPSVKNARFLRRSTAPPGTSCMMTDKSPHSVHVVECGDLSVAMRVAAGQAAESQPSQRAWPHPTIMCRVKIKMSGARAVGAATGGAGMMVELSPVPLGRCRGPWRERRRRPVPTCAREARSEFRFCVLTPRQGTGVLTPSHNALTWPQSGHLGHVGFDLGHRGHKKDSGHKSVTQVKGHDA